MLKYLKEQSEQTFERMQQWMGDYFYQEMQAVELLSTTIRQHIEKDEAIKYELRVQDGVSSLCFVFCWPIPGVGSRFCLG